MEFIKLFFVLLVKCLGNERGSISLTDGGADAGGSGEDPGSGNQLPNEGEPRDQDLNAGGQSGEPLFPDLPEDVKDDPSLKVFMDDKGNFNLASLAKSYVHAQRKIGEKGIRIPDDSSTPEEWADFYNKLRPAELEKYELKNSLPDGTSLDEELFTGFKAKAHEAGISPAQAQKLVDWFNEHSSGNQKALADTQAQAYQKEVEALQKEWGEGFKTELNTAQRALKEFADPETTEYLKKTGLDGNVQLIRLFNKIGKGLLEDKFDNESHGHFGMTKEIAQKKQNEIFGDSNHPYWNAHHAAHKDAVAEMEKLSQIIAS